MRAIRKKQNNKSAALCLALGAALVIACGGGSIWGQIQVGAGQGLDANRQVGSGGRNPSYSGGFNPSYGNQIISGNVGAGKSFKGLGGAGDFRDFQGSLGSSALSGFSRDSYGLSSNASSLGVAQPFYLPSSTVLGVRGITSGLAQPGSSMPGNVNLTPPPPSMPSQTPTGIIPKFSAPTPADLRINPQPISQGLPGLPQPVVETASNLFGIQRISPGLELAQPDIVTAGETLPKPMVDQLQTGAGVRQPFQALPDWAKPVEPGTSELEKKTLPPTPDQERLNQNLQEAKKLIDQSTGKSGVPSIVDIYEQMRAESAAEEQTGPSEAEVVAGAVSPIVPSVQQDQETAARNLVNKLRSYNTFVGGRRSSFNDYMAQGESLLKQGYYYQADTFYRRASEMQPENPLAYLGRAYSLAGAGDLISAADNLTKALEIFPEQAQEKIDLPKFFHSPAELDRITNKLVSLTEANKQDFRIRLLLGYFYHYSGQSNLAAPILTEAAELAKTDTKVPAELSQTITKFAQVVSKQTEKGHSQ